MSYAIHVKQVPTQTIVSARKEHATLGNLGAIMQSTLTTIGRAVHPSGAARGAPLAIYHNEPFHADDIDVEMGVPVSAVATIDEGYEVARHELPGGPVAYVVHEGSYASIGAAYDAIFAWLGEHGYHAVGAPRELYLIGPGQGRPPAEYRTEIDVPIG